MPSPDVPARPVRNGAATDVEPPAAGPAVRPGSSAPVRDLLLAYLQEQLAELLLQQRRLQASETEAIHKMRVSTRRLRSALASYRRLLPGEPALTLRADLRWLARVLGAARDAQVMRHRLQDLLASQPPDLILGPVPARIDEELLNEYTAALAVIREELDGDRYRRMVEGLQALVLRPDWLEAAAGPGRETAERMIRKDQARLRDRVLQAQAESDVAARAEILHEARKDAKRLRYAAETWIPAGGAEARTMVEAAEALQKALGEHQDSVVARALLRRLGTAPGESGFTYGRLHALEEQRAEAAEGLFTRLWQDFPHIP